MIIPIDKFEERIFYEVTAPSFAKNGESYKIERAIGYAFGAYVAEADIPQSDKKHICASVKVSTYGRESKAMPLLVFYGEQGKKLQSDYLSPSDDEYSVTVAIPTGAIRVSLELLAYSFDGGAEFTAPTLELVDAPAKRSFVAATAYFEMKGSTEENMRAMIGIIESAAKSDEKPDIICFTESAHDIKIDGHCYMKLDSEDVLRMRECARLNSIYVIFTFHEEDENGYHYNTAAVISPEGEIVGKYRKTQLTLGELKKGLTPGDSLPVIELPFAKIGIIICWDQWFYENSRMLSKNGAEIIFWPSRGYHEERIITRARDNGVYYVSSHPIPERCCIVHPTTGEILARGSGKSGYVSARIDLNVRPVSEYKSFGTNGGNDKEIFLNELRDGIYS